MCHRCRPGPHPLREARLQPNRPAPPPTPATRGASSRAGRHRPGPRTLVRSSAITRPSASQAAYRPRADRRRGPLAAALASRGGQVAARKYQQSRPHIEAQAQRRALREIVSDLAWPARSGRRGCAATPSHGLHPKRVAEVAVPTRGCRFPEGSRSPTSISMSWSPACGQAHFGRCGSAGLQLHGAPLAGVNR